MHLQASVHEVLQSQQRRTRSTLPSPPHRRPIKPQAQMAETAAANPPPAPPPATRSKLSGGLEPLDARIKELTSLQGELLARIQKLKQDVQRWRSNVEAQVKTCHNELVEVKEGLASEVQHLKSDIKEIRSALQEEKASSKTEQAGKTQDQVLKTDDEQTEQQTAVQA